MPVSTWTPIALASEARPWRGSGWRAAEAQHQVATLRLAQGDLRDQALLEDILESAKAPAPDSGAGLHFLLATPFRYWPLLGGSRFRRRTDPGVFYAGDERRTACAETGYWRLRFWLDSAALAGESATLQLTLFEFHAATQRALDLGMPPFVDAAEAWDHPSDYSATQALAEQARAADIEIIRYCSARRPEGACLALLTPAPFHQVTQPYRNRQQTWQLTLQPPQRVVWQRQLVRESWEFTFADLG